MDLLSKFEEISDNRIERLLKESEPYCQYGPTYNRHIATSANGLRSCREKGHSGKLLDSLADELEIRIKNWSDRCS